MAEIAGLVGLGFQLWKTTMELYDIFSDTQSFGSDHDRNIWQISTEQHRLKRWEEFWGVDDGTITQRLDPNDYRYRYAVGTLARIAALFANADNLNSKYGIKVVSTSTASPPPSITSSSSTQNVQGAATRRKRDRIFELLHIRKKSLKASSNTLTALKMTSPGLISSIDPNGVKVLQNPTILQNRKLVPGLDEEIVQIKGATQKLQQMLPAYKKLKWAVTDKAKFVQLIDELRKYNDGLYGVLPDPGPAQAQQPIQASPSFPKFNIPLQLQVQRNKKFVGREGLLDKLHKILDPSQNQTQRNRRVAVLHGLGGMGKTQIVTEYAYRNSTSYTSIFWIDATSKATLAHSSLVMMEQIISHYQSKWHDSTPDFAKIEFMLGLSGFIKSTGEIREECPPEKVSRAVKKWLSNVENDKWLIVFDNHDDIESVKMLDFFPTCDFGSVIVSTRRPEVAHLGDHGIEISGIEEKSGITILLSSAGKDPQLAAGTDYEEASKIAEKLGYLPLALDQAGGYISAMKIEFSEYLPLFNTNFKSLASANHPKISEMYRSDTLFTTWKISYDCLPPSGYNLLSLCAFLVNGNQEVPQDIFDRARGFVSWLPVESDFVNHGIKYLLSFSMAKRKTYQNEKSLCFHPLILEWTRDNLGVSGERTFTMRAIALLAGCIRSTNSGLMGGSSASNAEFERGIFPYIDVVVRHLRKLPDPSTMVLEAEFANALVEIGVFLVNYSRYMEAEEILLKSLEFHEEIANHESMIYQHDYHRALSNLGWICYNKLRLKESIGYFERALSGQEQMYGKDSLETVDTMGNMSIVLNAQQNQKAALEVQDRVIASYEKFQGKEHYSTLSAMLVKGELLGRGGDPAEAVELLRRTLTGLEETLGQSHPTTLRTVKALAWAIQRQGPENSHDAIELYKSVLATQEDMLGPHHLETVKTVSNLAFSYENGGYHKEALESYERVLECWKKEFGIEHPDTLATIRNISGIYHAQQRYQEALELHQQALVGEETVFGKESNSTCTTLYGIGECFHNLGKYADAIHWYKRLIAIQERVLGEDNFDTLKTMKGLARSLNENGKLKEALALFGRIIPIQEKVSGKNDEETLNVRSEMAHIIANQGRPQEALDEWESILAIQEEVLGKDHPNVLNNIASAAMAMKDLGRYQEALEFSERAVAGYEKICGPNDPTVPRILWTKALAKHGHGDHEEALELIRQALASLEKALGKEHPDVLKVNFIIAQFLDYKGEYQEAAEQYKRVLAIRRELFGPDHPWTINAAVGLSKVEAKLQ